MPIVGGSWLLWYQKKKKKTKGEKILSLSFFIRQREIIYIRIVAYDPL